MAFEFGFYNSINGDRKYNAIQISQIFDGVIMDGVFASIGDKLFTTANGGMEIAVGTGKAWFNHTWNLNTTKMVFTLTHSHAVLQRYDAVVLEVNDEQNVYGRVNAIKVIEGTPSSNAIKPTMIKTQYVHQYPLAYVKVNAAVEAITAADIEIVVGTTPCPFVTSVLQQTDITGLFANWNQQFTTWFNNLKAQLTDNVVTNLQNQINQCLKPTDIATSAQIKAGTSGKLVDAAGLKSNFQDMTYKVGDIIYTRRNTELIATGKWGYADGGLLYPNQYPKFRKLGWHTVDYAHRGNNINSSLNVYWEHQDIQLIHESVIFNMFFNQNNVTKIAVFDRISLGYGEFAFDTPGIFQSNCSGMGSCARFQDGKVMFVFWAQNGMWYVLECNWSAGIWNKDNWVLFSTASAMTSVPRQNMDTMYRYGNSLFVYEQNGGHAIKIDLEYTYKSLIVADVGIVNKNINLGTNVSVVKFPAELIIYKGAYFLPVVTSNNLVGLVEVAPTTGLGINFTLSGSVHAGRDLVRGVVRRNNDAELLVAFLSSTNPSINNGTYLAYFQIQISGPIGGLVLRVLVDERYDIADIPSERNKWVALAMCGIGYRNEGMLLATLNNDLTMGLVYSEHYKCIFRLNSLLKQNAISGTFIVSQGMALDFPIKWPSFLSGEMLSNVNRPCNTIWLYGEIWNDWAMATPYAIIDQAPGYNGRTENTGTRITYFPNYRRPIHNDESDINLGGYALVKLQD